MYRSFLKDGAGDADRDEAARVYDELLGKRAGGSTPDPLAPIVANHAGWFYLRVMNDPALAMRAARIDIAWHPSSDAFELALTAADADPARCEFARVARAFEHPRPALDELLRRVVGCP